MGLFAGLLLLSGGVLGYFYVWRNDERRRLLLARLIKMTRYEFWPTSLFYLPALCYYLYLCFPYRRLGLLGIVNPALKEAFNPLKTQVLAPLEEHARLAGFVAKCVALPREQRAAWSQLIRAFQRKYDLGFPLVIKPEMGQRGRDIYVLHNAVALRQLLARSDLNGDYLAQEYVGGLEYGIHYIRMPKQAQGRIHSLIRKERINLIGDGQSKLRALILRHPRAVLMARVHFQAHAARLDWIPVKDEEVQLVSIGAHSRGAIFRSNPHLITPALEKTIDRISKAYDGFYAGRYDIMVPSEVDLQTGRNLKIIELNGVMGEPGHLYHPDNSLREGYAILMEYCRLVVAIAAQNMQLGHRPPNVRQFITSVYRAYRHM